MTDALARVLERYANEALKRRFLPPLTSLTMDELQQGAMFLTEKQGGSDVGLTTTAAKPRSDTGDGFQPEWELWGDKWFCSNVSADIILTLARPEGAPAGTRRPAAALTPAASVPTASTPAALLTPTASTPTDSQSSN